MTISFPGTTVFYNGIVLANVVTREWNEELVYDQSGTDPIGTRIKLRFSGYIHAQWLISSAIGVITGVRKEGTRQSTAATVYQEVHNALSESRKTLKVWVNDEELLICVPPDADKKLNPNRDIDNGPKPRGLNITKVVGDNVFHVEWSVECMKLLCDTSSAVQEVLNNRWAISEEIDANFYTTRTIRGHMRLSGTPSEAASNYKPAHSYRSIVVPGLEKGFKRERIEYAVSENGLEVEYQISDRQVHTAAPWPATEMEATHSAGTNDGVSFISSMNVRLTGPPHADKRLMIARCAQLIAGRLDYLNRRENLTAWVQSAIITEQIGAQNVVDFSLTLSHQPSSPIALLDNIAANDMGKPMAFPDAPGQPYAYDPQKSQLPALYGYDPQGSVRSPAYLFLLTCYLQSPCRFDNHAITQVGATAAAELYAQNPDTAVSQVSPGSLTGISNMLENYSASHLGQNSGVYVYAKAESVYDIEPLVACLPIAKTVTEGGANADADTVAFIDLGPGIAYRTIRVEAERIGAPPEIPMPAKTYTDGTLKGRLLGLKLTVLPTTLSPDGQSKVYRTLATYRYGLNRLPRNDEKLRVGVLPYTSATIQSNAFDGAKSFKENLGP